MKTQIQSLSWEDPQEEGMGILTLDWRILWTEEPGGLQSMGSHRVRHSLATKPSPLGRLVLGGPRDALS